MSWKPAKGAGRAKKGGVAMRRGSKVLKGSVAQGRMAMDMGARARTVFLLLVPLWGWPLACKPAAIVSGTGGSSGSGGEPNAGGTAGRADASVINVNLDVPASANADTAAAVPPTPDANCGMIVSETVREPVDVLLVLDRSQSMTYNIAENCYCTGTTPNSASLCRDGGACTDRWTAINSALATTLAATGTSLRWGLELFASGLTCIVNGPPEVPIAPDSSVAIQAKIASTTPGSNTPTRAAIAAATSYLQGLADKNKKYILLATDGDPNCGVGMDQSVSDIDGATAAVSEAAAAGFQVYVVGIGPSVSNLTKLAAAGGTKDYFPATSPEQLTSALASISSFVASCSYNANQAPPDPSNIAVYVNKQRVDKSEADGWQFGASTQEIVLTGSYCQQVTSGSDMTVEILFGCPGLPSFPTVIP